MPQYSTTPEARRRQSRAAQQLAAWCAADDPRALRVAALIAQGQTIAQAIRIIGQSDAAR